MSEHRRAMDHELPVLIPGRLLLWCLLLFLVNLSLHGRHVVGHVLEKLCLFLQKLLHG